MGQQGVQQVQSVLQDVIQDRDRLAEQLQSAEAFARQEQKNVRVEMQRLMEDARYSQPQDLGEAMDSSVVDARLPGSQPFPGNAITDTSSSFLLTASPRLSQTWASSPTPRQNAVTRSAHGPLLHVPVLRHVAAATAAGPSAESA